MNDTGEAVYGLRVEFSEPVTITGFGDVLTVVSPESEAPTFIFSGGELKAWSGHWLNWEPASAEILRSEWQYATTGNTSYPTTHYYEGLPRNDQQPLPVLVTYDDIMEKIAEYPRSDEPLYEPDPDEAIWLTDLEGHGDIYDNDSIRINYAPGFDQSQVRSVEIYRNDVKMRFLPEVVDVLTNQQMKTFDGNTLEHSPASNHSDHAIFGFQYEFVVASADGSSLSASTRIVSPFVLSGMYKYANFLSNWHLAVDGDSMSDFAVQEYLHGIARLGFNGINFGTVIFTPDDRRAEFFSQSEYDADISRNEGMTTASGESILKLLGWIDDAGLQAELEVQLWVSEKYAREQGGHRSFVQPDDIDEWFAAYGDAILPFAKLAEQGGAEYFRPVVEFNTLQSETEYMDALLTSVQDFFSGDLVVGESTNHHIYNMADFYPGEFWNHPDLILGMNCWSPSMETQRDQRLSYMVERFVSDWLPFVEYYRGQYPEIPLIFSEIGWYNYDGSALGNSDWGAGDIRDDQEMADAWAAYLIASEYLGLDGVDVWTMGLANPFASNGGSCVNYSSALPIIGSLLGGTPTTSVPIQQRDDAIEASAVDWQNAPILVTFPSEVPVDYVCNGDTNLENSTLWNQSGKKVETVKFAIQDNEILLGVELHDDDEFGEFRYKLSLYMPNHGSLIFSLEPSRKSLWVEFHASDGDEKQLYIAAGTEYFQEPGAAYAIVPWDAIMGYVSRSQVCMATPELNLIAQAGRRYELFFFPGTYGSIPCR